MDRVEQTRIVLCIISQFNREIREETVKRLFDDEYDPHTITEEDLSEIICDLCADNKITIGQHGYLHLAPGIVCV